MNTRTPEPARPPEPSRHPRGTFPYQNRPAPPPADGRASLSPDPASPAASGPRPASPPCRSSLRRRLRPPENAATLLRGARTVALALAALVLGVPETAEAQTATTFISNVGQGGSTASANPRATAFTTGGSSEGYGLTSVEVYSGINSSTVTPRVEIFRNNASDRPGTRLATLTNPANLTGAGTKNFNDPANTILSANTTYWLVVSNAAETDGVGFRIGTAGNATADDGAAMGWSIGNSLFKLDISTGWSTTGNRIIFTVKGSPVATNTPATGAPTITGTVEVGQTLTAVTTGILDANGLTSPTYTYQWIRVDSGTDSDISGANSSTYPLAAADEGKTIKVRVTFDDDDGNTETLTSTATAVVAATTDTTPPEVKSVRVDLVGLSVLILFDEALDENAANAVPVSAYAVTADGQAVTITLVISLGDTVILQFPDAAIRQGQTVVVSYTDPTAGNDTVALQDLVGNDVASFSVTVNTAATGAPTITGTAQVDQTLTAVTTGIMDADGLTSPTYTYQWIRVDSGTDSEIAGARSSTYTLAAADEGKTIKVQVTFDDDAGTTETLTSAATTVVAAAADATCAATSFGDRRNFWTGTVTVTPVNIGPTTGHGFSTDYGPGSSLLPDRRFSIGSNAYQIYEISARSTGALRFSTASGSPLSAAHRAALRLHVCDVDYDFSAATLTGGGNYNWSGSLDWSSVTTRTVYLSLPANNAATGAPAITGTATVDEMLTATAGDIADTDGLPSSFTYQWFRVDADGTSNEEEISGATVATYTLTDDDIDKRIKVKVSFTDNLNGKETRTSAATAVVATTPPEVVSVEVNSQGELLTILFDKALDEDAARAVPDSAYVVTVDGQDVTITETSVFSGDTVILSVPGAAIRQGQTVTVSYTDPTAGDDTVALQDVTGNDVAGFTTGRSGVPAVTNGSTVPSADTTPPEVEGVVVNEVSMFVSIIFDEDLDENAVPPVNAFSVTADEQAVTITYVQISGTIVSLEFPDAAIRQDQTVVASYTDPTGDDDTVALQDVAGNDVASFTVTANTPATGAPTITGTVEVGQTLTAVTTGIMDANGLTGITYDYQWLRVTGTEAAIAGAKSSTYLLVAADLGKTIKVEVGFRDADGYLELRTSAATAMVTADMTQPELAMTNGATVSGNTLTLTYDEPLDENSTPPPSAYTVTVTVGTTTTTPAVTMVSVHDSMVTLTLDPAPAAGATVTLEYEVPGTTPVQDEAGNPAPRLIARSVTRGVRRRPPPPPPPTNTPPVVAIPPVDQEATTGDLFTYVIPADAFTDADGDRLTYAAALSDGGRLPSWLTFDAATQTFTGTPGPGDGGTVRVTVMASDGTATVSDEFALRVTVRNTAPVVANPLADQDVMIDVPFTYVVPADAFTDADGDPLAYTAATRDGGMLPSWLTFDAATRTFTGTPASSDSGPVFVTVTASDRTATVSDEFALRVLMVAPSTLRAWTSRFGRTVATHVTDAVGERLRASPEQDSQVTVGGYRLPLGRQAAGGGGPDATEPETATDRLASLLTGLVGRALGLGPAHPQGGGPGTDLWAEPPAADPRLGQSQTLHLPTVRLRDVLLGSSFRLNLGDDAAAPWHMRLTAWGRVAGTQFDGRDGALTLDGNVLTGTVGVDSAWDRWPGVAVSHSLGGGSFTGDGDGDLDSSTLTSIHPYLRYAVNERVDVWSVLGYGWGDMTLEPGTGGTLETDTTLLMGSFGGRGILLSAPDNAGFQLATRTDAMLTRTTSGAVAGLAETEADAHRLRLVLEGTRPVLWPEGQSVTPTVELGVRHDWGDAETGFGLELGGRVQYADPTLGLTIEAAVRGLLTHEDSDYKEWGASGTIRLAPDPNGQGLSLTLAPTWGAASSGIESLWSRQTTAGLAPQGTRPRPTTSLNAEMGYGVAAPFGTGLLTPYAGTVLTDGQARTYRLGTRWTAVSGLSLTLEGLRQESPGQQPVNQGLHLQIGWGF